MAPLYERICSELKWEVDDMLLGKMRGENEARLAELEQAISNAEENEGETEVKDAMIAKAESPKTHDVEEVSPTSVKKIKGT